MPVEDDKLRCRWRKCFTPGSFDSHKELYEHLIDAHNPPRYRAEFRCRWDGCRGRSQLEHRCARTIHFLSHTEYRPHTCGASGCGARFKRKFHLEMHSLRHVRDRNEQEDEQGEALLDCKACDKAFSLASALKAHMHFAHYRQSGTRTTKHLHGVASESSQSEPKGLTVEDWSDDEAVAITHPDDPGTPDSDSICEDQAQDSDQLLAAKKRIEDLEVQKEALEALLREARADYALGR